MPEQKRKVPDLEILDPIIFPLGAATDLLGSRVSLNDTSRA